MTPHEFGQKVAGSRWREAGNLAKIIFQNVKTLGDRNAVTNAPWFRGSNSRAASLLSAKGKLGLPQTLPKLQQETAQLPWRPIMPEIKDAVRFGRLKQLYRGTTESDPFWSTTQAPSFLGPTGSLAHKPWVHATPFPQVAASYGATLPGQGGAVAPGSLAGLVSRHAATGKELFSKDWVQGHSAGPVGNTWLELLAGMKNKRLLSSGQVRLNPLSLQTPKTSPDSAIEQAGRVPFLWRGRAYYENAGQRGIARGSKSRVHGDSPAYEAKIYPQTNPHQGYSLATNKAIADIPNNSKWRQILKTLITDRGEYNPHGDMDATLGYAYSQDSPAKQLYAGLRGKMFTTPADRAVLALLPKRNPVSDQPATWLQRLRQYMAVGASRLLQPPTNQPK